MSADAQVAASWLLVAAYVVLTRTPYGQYITGIGANAEAVRIDRIPARILDFTVPTGRPSVFAISPCDIP